MQAVILFIINRLMHGSIPFPDTSAPSLPFSFPPPILNTALPWLEGDARLWWHLCPPFIIVHLRTIYAFITLSRKSQPIGYTFIPSHSTLFVDFFFGKFRKAYCEFISKRLIYPLPRWTFAWPKALQPNFISEILSDYVFIELQKIVCISLMTKQKKRVLSLFDMFLIPIVDHFIFLEHDDKKRPSFRLLLENEGCLESALCEKVRTVGSEKQLSQAENV